MPQEPVEFIATTTLYRPYEICIHVEADLPSTLYPWWVMTVIPFVKKDVQNLEKILITLISKSV